MADGVSSDGNGDEPLVLPAPEDRTDLQSFINLMQAEWRTNRTNRQEAQAQLKAQIKEEIDQLKHMKTNRQEVQAQQRKAEQAQMKAMQDQQDQWQQ